MVPDVVTFWHGRLDRLRRLCLGSQVAAGHIHAWRDNEIDYYAHAVADE